MNVAVSVPSPPAPPPEVEGSVVSRFATFTVTVQTGPVADAEEREDRASKAASIRRRQPIPRIAV